MYVFNKDLICTFIFPFLSISILEPKSKKVCEIVFNIVYDLQDVYSVRKFYNFRGIYL